MTVFAEYYKKLLEQLSRDYNCTPGDLRSEKNTVTLPALNEGRRIYSPDTPFFQMVTAGPGTVMMADERLHGFLRDFAKDKEGHRLFEFGNLCAINDELKKYGWTLKQSHHMFLPCREVSVDDRFTVKWFFGSEIDQFYGDARFPNAISYPEPCPARPDRIVVTACDGEEIMGMSGCSEDAPHWQQIGIDVLPAYRTRGIGKYLVTLVKNRITELGDIPFYGTAAANIRSQNIARAAGFRPAWVEIDARKLD